MTAAEIIERARKAEAERDGRRLKVRVPTALWRRVRACADVCGVSVEEYACGACRGVQAGRIRVASAENSEMGTREASVVVWIRVPHEFDAGAESLRPALAAAVERTLAKVGPLEARPVEGVDFYVEGRTYKTMNIGGLRERV